MHSRNCNILVCIVVYIIRTIRRSSERYHITYSSYHVNNVLSGCRAYIELTAFGLHISVNYITALLSIHHTMYIRFAAFCYSSGILFLYTSSSRAASN